VDYFFLTFLLEEERLTLEREELELREERLTVDREELELREDRLTVEREGLELRLGVEILLLEDDCVLPKLLDGVREVDLRTELDEDGLRTVRLEDFELREGAVVTRPLEEADEEEVEENLRIEFLAALLFSVEVEDLFVVIDRDGVWEREEEENLFVTGDRLGVVRFTLLVEDLNLEGAILFLCVAGLLDFTDFCELGEYLFMYREEIPDL
jgi:hypothetical protein